MKMPSFFIRYACGLVGIMWFFEGRPPAFPGSELLAQTPGRCSSGQPTEAQTWGSAPRNTYSLAGAPARGALAHALHRPYQYRCVLT